MYLSGNRIYIQGAENLAHALDNGDVTLRMLDISGCYMGKGVRIFPQMLGRNTRLDVLNMGSNELGQHEARRLGRSSLKSGSGSSSVLPNLLSHGIPFRLWLRHIHESQASPQRHG